MTDKPRVTLIDLSSLFWQAWSVNAENGMREPRAITLAGVQRARGDAGDLVAICCDGKNNFRKQISAEYKANRDKQPEAAYGELDRCKERLRADGYLLWEFDTFEADDVIATACKDALNAGHDVRIASADKDLMALVSERVDVLRTHTWEVWSLQKFKEKFRINPPMFYDWLALKGDSSDNIPGCPGVGDKRASDLLMAYGSISGIYQSLASDPPRTDAVSKNLIEHRAAVELSRKLVELRFDVPLQFDEIYQERKASPLTEKTDLPEDGDPTDAIQTSIQNATDAMEPVNALQSGEQEVRKGSSESNGSTAGVALVPVEYERQLEPRSLRAAVWLGQHLYDSRLYTRFPTPEAITAVIIRGREMGLGATTALDVFHVIDGKPVPYAWFIISLAMNCRECEYLELIDGADNKSATWKTKRRGNTSIQTCTYTYDQAVAAKLPKEGQRGPNAWLKNPEDMLVKTAGVKLARRVYPAQTLGLYAVEELGGDEV